MLYLETGIFTHQLGQDLPQPLLIATPLGRNRQAMHRRREGQRPEVDMVVLSGIVQHGVKVQLVDLGNGADVAGQRTRHLNMRLALQPVQMRHLEGLAAVADIQLAARCDRALVHPQHAQLADVGIDRDLEDMGQHMGLGVGLGLQWFGGSTLALQKVGRVALAGVRQQVVDDVEQLGHAGTGAGRDKTHGDQMALAQRLLQRGVQLGWVDVAILQVALDKGGIHLDHLLNQGPVGHRHAAQIAVAGAVEKAVQHPHRTSLAVGQRQIHR